MCDLVNTPCIYKYVESLRSLEIVSYHQNDTSWITAIELLDNNTIMASDSTLCIKLFTFDPEKSGENSNPKLKVAGILRTGDFVNRIIKCEYLSCISLFSKRKLQLIFVILPNQVPQSNICITDNFKRNDNIIYCTTSGAVCLICNVDKPCFEALRTKEKNTGAETFANKPLSQMKPPPKSPRIHGCKYPIFVDGDYIKVISNMAYQEKNNPKIKEVTSHVITNGIRSRTERPIDRVGLHYIHGGYDI